MAQFGASVQMMEYTNWLTQVNPYVTTVGAYLPNGQKNPLGQSYFDNTPATGTSTNAAPRKLKYVRYLSASNPTPTNCAGPFPVYWADANYTTVTPVATESISGGINSIAGLCGPNTTSMGQSAGALQGLIGGSFLWICTYGFVANAAVGTTGTAADAALIGSATPFKIGSIAAGTASTNRILGWATAAVAAAPTYLQNVFVTLES